MKFSLSGWQKAVLVAVLLIDIIKIVQAPAVARNFSLFLTLGLVPGSNGHAMSPDAVIKLCIVVFVVAFLLIFGSNIFRFFFHLGVRLPKNDTALLRAAPMRQVAPEGSSVVQPEKTPGAAGRPKAFPARNALPGLLDVWAQARLKLLLYIAVAMPIVKRLAGLAKQHGRIVALWMWRELKRAWRFSEPYLRRADKQIELRIRRALGLQLGA